MDKHSGSKEEEISMPISRSLATMSDSPRQEMLASSALADAEKEESKKKFKYRECLKNHAASLGGHAVDGCGKFMPSGEEGTMEGLLCASCRCHRNFHRREVEGEAASNYCYDSAETAAARNVRTLPFALPQMLMAFNKGGGVAEAEEEREGSFLSSHGNVTVKKRFKTKLTLEQKERMLGFAQKLGWRIQKHDEADVQNFCLEVGIKRHVLKVWMHNNKHKHTVASKSENTANTDTINNNTSTSTTADANAINNNSSNNLFKKLPGNIEERPKMSYDALNEEEKQMFLDTACFFIGEENSLAIAIWDGSGWNVGQGWESLINKDLVYLDENNRIRMYDELRDLGREIADQQSPYRLGSPSQFNQIRPQQKHLEIRGMVNATGDNCYSSKGNIIINQGQVFCSHRPGSLGLKLLVCSGEFLNEEVGELSKELLWLRWNDFKHANLPSWLLLENLRVLELNGALNLRGLWADDAHAPLQLRELIITGTLSASFQRFPSSLSRLQHLKKIALLGSVGKEFGIERLPEEFCHLQSLEHLELRYCIFLLSLPAQFGNLRNLRHLDLCFCKALRKLPVSFEKLTCLNYLDLSGCKRLVLWIDILKNIIELKNLYLSGCLELQKLPLQITVQSCLRELQLQKTSLEDLPRNIGQLGKLEALTIGSPLLKRLPASLGNLCSLKRLSIIGCSALKSLPKTLGHLQLLEHLYIKGTEVKSLAKGFRRLANLQTLKISDCPLRELDLGSVSYFSLEKLKVIKLRETSVTRISISEHCCPRLEALQLSKNDDLEEIETLPATVNNIVLSECETLKNIKGILALPTRPSLSISECPKLPNPSYFLI